jgi:uncharacterized surface anchored protein
MKGMLLTKSTRQAAPRNRRGKTALAAGSVDFTIKADQTQVKLTATNQKKPGQLDLKKQAETIKDDHFPDRQPMTGAEFKLYRYDEAGKVDRSRSWDATITNNDGTVSFKDSDLYEGKYQLVETKAPDGYVIPDELAKGVDVDITGDQTLTLPTITEPVYRRTASVAKTDGNFGNPIAGITYALYREDGTELAKDLVTDKNGQSMSRLVCQLVIIIFRKRRPCHHIGQIRTNMLLKSSRLIKRKRPAV